MTAQIPSELEFSAEIKRCFDTNELIRAGDVISHAIQCYTDNPYFRVSQIKLATLLFKEHKDPKHLEICEEASVYLIRNHTENFSLVGYSNLGFVYRERQAWSNLEAVANTILKINPNDSFALGFLCNIATARKDWGGLKVLCHQILKHHPRERPFVLSFLSQVAYAEKDWKNLEAYAQERLEQDPRNIFALNDLCSCALHHCHWDQLDALVDIRLKKDPHDLRAYIFLCQKGTAQKNWKYVEERALEVQAFAPGNFLANHYLFLCYTRSERVDEASKLLIKLESESGTNALLVHKVELLVASRDFDGAIDLIRSAEPEEKNDCAQRLLADLVDGSLRAWPMANILDKIAVDLRNLANQVVKKPQVVATAPRHAHDVSATVPTAPAAR